MAFIKSLNFFKNEDDKLRDEAFDKEYDENNFKWYYYPVVILTILFLLFYYQDISSRIDVVYKIQDQQLRINIDEIVKMTDRLLDEDYDDNDKVFLDFKLDSEIANTYYIHSNIQESAFLFEDIEYDFMHYIDSSISYIRKCVDKKQISGIDKEVLRTINKDLRNINDVLTKEKDIDIYILSKARANLKEKYKELNEIFKNIELNNTISKIYMNTDEEYEEKYAYKTIYNLLENKFGYKMIGSFEYEKDYNMDDDKLVLVDFDSDIRFKKIWNHQDIPSVNKMFEFRVSKQDELLNTDKMIVEYLSKKGIKMIDREYETDIYQLPEEYDKALVDKVIIEDNDYEVYTNVDYEFNIDNIIIELNLDTTGVIEVSIVATKY